MNFKKFQPDELTWFSLNRYEELAGLSYVDWQQLSFHRDLLWRITEPYNIKELKERYSSAYVTARLTPIAKQLQSDPLTACQPDFQPLDEGLALATATIKLHPLDYVGSAPVPENDINALLFGTIDGVPLYQAFEESPQNGRRVFLEVDIDAPNNQLIADFETWLDLWRKHFGEPRKPKVTERKTGWTPAMVKRWVQQPLLPYIDLRLVCRLMGRSIDNAKLKELISPTLTETEWATTQKRLDATRQSFLNQQTMSDLYYLGFGEPERSPT